MLVSPADLLLAEVRAGKTLSSSPFGYDGGVWYSKRPVYWKGLKGEAFWSAVKGTGIERGLRSAIEISKRHAGEYGVALVERIDGVYEIVPLKCASQMRDAGTLQRIVATAPTSMALMTRAYALGMIGLPKITP